MPKLHKTLSVYSVVGGSAAISIQDGKNLFEKMDAVLSQGASVVLDFINIEIMTSTFLNEAVGQLYSKYTREQLGNTLTFQNLASDDEKLMHQVMERAEEYFKDPRIIEEALKDTFEFEDESDS